jgi:DNA-binding LacI/PurR family transcriptional regulator
MHRHGLDAHVQIVPGGPTEDSTIRATNALLAQKPIPTGILAFNDRCATSVLDILLRAGVAVPGQVSVVGFDDSHLAGFSHINLTTVRQDASVMAELAVDRAVQRLTHQTDTTPADAGGRDMVVPPTLVIRGTTGPITSRQE